MDPTAIQMMPTVAMAASRTRTTVLGPGLSEDQRLRMIDPMMDYGVENVWWIERCLMMKKKRETE